MKDRNSIVSFLAAHRVPGTQSSAPGLVPRLPTRFLTVRGSSARLAIAMAAISLFLVGPAWTDVVPYFIPAPQDSTAQAIQDLLADVSSAQLFLVAGCVIVAMEAIFFVGLVRARKRHGNK